MKLALEGNHRDFEEAVVTKLTNDTSAVLVWAPPDEQIIVWLRRKNLSDWLTEEVEATQLEREGLDRLLADINLVPQVIDQQHSVALFETDSVFKASLLLAPGLRAKVEPLLGWPVCAVAPCRDFVMLFRDFNNLLFLTFFTPFLAPKCHPFCTFGRLFGLPF